MTNVTPIRVWLMEDNPGDVFLFREALERAELKSDLFVIDDGAEAVRLIGRHESCTVQPPDLAVVDLNLPKVGGLEILETMRRSQVFSDVPVVITSSVISPYDRAHMERLRVDRYFAKPSGLNDYLQIGFVLKDVLHARAEDRAPQGMRSASNGY